MKDVIIVILKEKKRKKVSLIENNYYMNNKKIILISILIFIILVFSGCIDLQINNSNLIYENHPTIISYIIEYGYYVNITGKGNLNIIYNCDIPKIILGNVSILNILYNKEFSEKIIANNSFISWNIEDYNKNNYKLGIKAIIQSESFLINDISGTNADTLQELKNNHNKIIEKYCNSQSNDTAIFIDPENLQIINTANKIKNNTVSNNTLILAKELFKWLKENIKYQKHTINKNIQPASYTIQKKTGDCDDISFLYISLCRAIKIPARFIRGYLIEQNNNDINIIPHAWVEVFVGENIGNNGWIPVECAGNSNIETEIHQNFGIEDAFHLRLFIDNGDNESLNESISGIMMIYDEEIKINLKSFENIYDFSIIKSNELSIKENGIRMYI
jgi:hypothetical protein